LKRPPTALLTAAAGSAAQHYQTQHQRTRWLVEQPYLDCLLLLLLVVVVLQGLKYTVLAGRRYQSPARLPCHMSATAAAAAAALTQSASCCCCHLLLLLRPPLVLLLQQHVHCSPLCCPQALVKAAAA
jgi:hypothetical protein